jgi:hypothetical protein
MSEPIFKGNDLRLIESLAYDPSLEPTYSPMRNHLMWSDEMPDGLTPEGYETLCDLWIARSFVQRGLDFSEHPLDPSYISEFWERALAQNFKWPGFSRLNLSSSDKAYYETMMIKAKEGSLF